MKLIDYILLVIVIIILALAIRKIILNKRYGKGCNCGCDNCSNTACKGRKI